MKIAEAAEKLDLAKGTLRRMCQRGELPAGVKAVKVHVKDKDGRRAYSWGQYHVDGSRNKRRAMEWDVKVNS